MGSPIDLTDGSWTLYDPVSMIKSVAFAAGKTTVTFNAVALASIVALGRRRHGSKSNVFLRYMAPKSPSQRTSAGEAGQANVLVRKVAEMEATIKQLRQENKEMGKSNMKNNIKALHTLIKCNKIPFY